MTGVVRLGLAGAGLIGRTHAELIARSSQCVLAGVADPSPDAQTVASKFNAPWHASIESLLDAERPDGVIIASPNNLHVPMAIACIDRAVPALIEKPVAESIAAARQLVAASRRGGIPLLVGHHRRHSAWVKAARDVVRRGELGTLTAVACLWLLKKPDDYFEVGWRTQPDGGGPLLINAIHDVDTLRFVCGEITEVQAIASNGVRGFAVEDSAALLLRFAGGALGTVTLSDVTPAPWSWELTSGENPAYPRQAQACCFFAGTRGSLSIPDLTQWTYRQAAEGWNQALVPTRLDVRSHDPLAEQLRHFLAVIAGDETPIASVGDAARTLSVVEAVKQATAREARVAPETIEE
jgi:predicted dehydrogenase